MKKRKKIWVNGCFDVLHVGHIRLLEFASRFGDVRVGLDTDERIKELKGGGRPYNTLETRIEIMRAIRYVKEVVTFSSLEEQMLRVKEYMPDIMIKGDEYEGTDIPGAEYAKELMFFKKVEGHSTTNILSYEERNKKPPK